MARSNSARTALISLISFSQRSLSCFEMLSERSFSGPQGFYGAAPIYWATIWKAFS